MRGGGIYLEQEEPITRGEGYLPGAGGGSGMRGGGIYPVWRWRPRRSRPPISAHNASALTLSAARWRIRNGASAESGRSHHPGRTDEGRSCGDGSDVCARRYARSAAQGGGEEGAGERSRIGLMLSATVHVGVDCKGYAKVAHG